MDLSTPEKILDYLAERNKTLPPINPYKAKRIRDLYASLFKKESEKMKKFQHDYLKIRISENL